MPESALTFNRDLGAAMVSKCANPECPVPFQYFREGKLFRIEAGRVTSAGPTLVSGKRPQSVEHYWLCGACSARLTLTYDRDKGVVITPLVRAAVRRAAAS
ncbi:MAG: hypothetical protein L0Z53_14745 [Acidobacteriales bacterium]|nr:hypothetical protein [Terriglobales bacterium]